MNALALLEPLVPADCDLTGLNWMPLDVMRLRDSGISGVDDAEAFRAAVLLWCVAWHQIPAASLPSDDKELCKLAGLGRDRRRWDEIREEALRGFHRCSDGRLYHRLIAEKALEAWIERLSYRKRSAKGNASRYAHLALSPEAFDEAIVLAKHHLAALKPKARKAALPPQNLLEGGEKAPCGDPGKDPGKDPCPDSEVTGTGTVTGKQEKKAPPLRVGAKENRSQGSPAAKAKNPPAVVPEKRPSKDQGHRLPVDWFANAGDRQYAVLLGFSAEEVDEIEESFRLWWPAQPGAKGRKTDWSLTWKTWCRTERTQRNDRKKRTGAGGGSSKQDDRFRAFLEGGVAASDDQSTKQPRGRREDP